MEVSKDWRFLPGIPTRGQTLCLEPDDLPGFTVAPPAATQYCLIALPHGLAGFSTALWPKIWQVTQPGGVLYVGFPGRGRRLWGRQQLPGPAASPGQVARQLRQAGYQQLTLYGALPNHLRPTYLLPLQADILSFVLRRYLKKIRSRRWRHRLTHPLLCRWLVHLLPAYAITAIKQDA